MPGVFQAIGSNVDVTAFTLVGLTANATDVVATIPWAYTVKATGQSAAAFS